MFLKRIEVQGFKSFADKSIITFDSNVIGIVGPNGCGKSNINDAIRWTLGEQSAKTLRAESMSDLVFSGSQSRKAVNLAEVTLVFDNSKHIMKVDFDEVEITRRIHRVSGESEYLINKTPCRLKDITDMMLDTGLGKNSLSFISQGDVASFSDARPEDRRSIFEEAAGVAKYKKRKVESVNKLNRTDDNLSRAEDIISELERQVLPLKRQAEKAKKYIDKKEQLETIEISVIVDEIENLNKEAVKLEEQSFDLEGKAAICDTAITLNDNGISELRTTMSALDIEINTLQGKLMKKVEEVTNLSTRKAEQDEKFKHLMEYATDQEKLPGLKKKLTAVEYEYNELKATLDGAETDLELEKEKEKQNDELYETAKTNATQALELYNKLANRQELLNKLIQQPFNHQQGVKAIIEAKSSLNGIMGVVSQVLVPKDGYEDAISNALGGSLYHIVTENEQAARNAINFLKKNQSGRATFLPTTVLKDRYVAQDALLVANNTQGFLGCAYDFIECEECYDIVSSSLLGNVMICDNLAHANELARSTKYNYKIVTLDGDLVHKGGSMSGGKIKDSYSPLAIASELKGIDTKVSTQRDLLDKYNDEVINMDSICTRIKGSITEYRLTIARTQPLVDAKKASYDSLKDEFDSIAPKDEKMDKDAKVDELIVQLTQAEKEKDAIVATISTKRSERITAGNELERKNNALREARRDSNTISKDQKDNEISKARVATKLENEMERLASNYEMTFEFASTKKIEMDMEQARIDVVRLRNEISALGNVNLEAPEEYEGVRERYETLCSQRDELISAKNKILEAISEMDDIMIVQFKEMFDKINNELHEVF
ncbi:MAG: AAA family ATPase [Erysipelotrichaceae bacterium]